MHLCQRDQMKDSDTRFTADARQIRRFRARLRAWGKKHICSYPWRYSTDTYAVFVAEFMLHRTQARQVLPVYERFISRYPSLDEYSGAQRAGVSRVLQPLGLRWRIKALIQALNDLRENYGEVPPDYNGLLSIYGVGQYIAGATVCFTQDKPIALVDSNTVRVIGRVFGLKLSGEARRKPQMIGAIGAVCDPRYPRDYYYALIDLAHMVCRPASPTCVSCPLLDVPCSYGRGSLGVQEGS